MRQDEGISTDARRTIKGARLYFLKKRDELEQIDIDYATEFADRRIALATTLDLTDEDIAELAALKPREARCSLMNRPCEVD